MIKIIFWGGTVCVFFCLIKKENMASRSHIYKKGSSGLMCIQRKYIFSTLKWVKLNLNIISPSLSSGSSSSTSSKSSSFGSPEKCLFRTHFRPFTILSFWNRDSVIFRIYFLIEEKQLNLLKEKKIIKPTWKEQGTKHSMENKELNLKGRTRN